VIQSDSFSGLQAAAALLKREKEVILVPPGENFMIGYFDTGTMAWLQEKFAETGLRVLTDNPIKEVLGDKEAKAVRLKTGKIFSAEIILFMETGEDLRLFSDSGIPMGRAIEVDEDFRAGGVDNVFAVDRPGGWGEGDPVTPLAVLEEQAQKVAAVIRGKEHQFILPVLKRSVSVGGITITLLGQTQERDGVMVKQVFTPESGKYQRLFIEQGCLVGAVLVNREEDKEDLLRRIDAREHFEWQDDVPQNGNSTGTGVYSAAGTENVSTELVDN
jgi:NAD(P)H-nitrite reductase large subunit